MGGHLHIWGAGAGANIQDLNGEVPGAVPFHMGDRLFKKNLFIGVRLHIWVVHCLLQAGYADLVVRFSAKFWASTDRIG